MVGVVKLIFMYYKILGAFNFKIIMRYISWKNKFDNYDFQKNVLYVFQIFSRLIYTHTHTH